MSSKLQTFRFEASATCIAEASDPCRAVAGLPWRWTGQGRSADRASIARSLACNAVNLACITLPYPGHINPMAALAKELERRGHRATFFHYADVGPAVARWGLRFVPLGDRSHPTQSMSRAVRDAGRVTGLLGHGPMIRGIAITTAMLCEELPRALEDHAIDMILSDQLEAAGGLVAYHTHVPHVSLAAALPINWERGVPSPFVGWKYGETEWHRRRKPHMPK